MTTQKTIYTSHPRRGRLIILCLVGLIALVLAVFGIVAGVRASQRGKLRQAYPALTAPEGVAVADEPLSARLERVDYAADATILSRLPAQQEDSDTLVPVDRYEVQVNAAIAGSGPKRFVLVQPHAYEGYFLRLEPGSRLVLLLTEQPLLREGIYTLSGWGADCFYVSEDERVAPALEGTKLDSYLDGKLTDLKGDIARMWK